MMEENFAIITMNATFVVLEAAADTSARYSPIGTEIAASTDAQTAAQSTSTLRTIVHVHGLTELHSS